MAYMFDLHLHSRMSHDCTSSFQALISMCRRRKLSGIALTDHDTMDGVEQLRDIWPHEKLQLIAGCERTLDDGSHIIGLFLRRPLVATSLRETVREIREQEGLFYLPHPFRVYSGLLRETSGYDFEERSWALAEADIVEVYNPKCTILENRQALELLAQHPKAFAASSDAHYPFQIGYAYTLIERPLSPKAFSPSAAFAPLAGVDLEDEAMASHSGESKFRSGIRKALGRVGLLEPAKALRNQVRCYLRPNLQRYR